MLSSFLKMFKQFSILLHSYRTLWKTRSATVFHRLSADLFLPMVQLPETKYTHPHRLLHFSTEAAAEVCVFLLLSHPNSETSALSQISVLQNSSTEKDMKYGRRTWTVRAVDYWLNYPGVLPSLLASQWNKDRHPYTGEEPTIWAINTIKGLQHLIDMRQREIELFPLWKNKVWGDLITKSVNKCFTELSRQRLSCQQGPGTE